MSRASKKAKDTNRREGAASGSHHEERRGRKAQPRSQDENDASNEQLSLEGTRRRARADRRSREEHSRNAASQDDRPQVDRSQDEIETLPLMPPVQRGEESHARRTAAADTRDGGRPEERSSARSTRKVSDRDAAGRVRGDHRPKEDAADTDEPASAPLRGYRKGRDARERGADSGSDGSRGAWSDRGDVSPH